MQAPPNKYSVHNRLSLLESRLAALDAENKNLRLWIEADLTSKLNGALTTIRDTVAADFRDLQASIRIPQDGKDGKDGESIVGPQGSKGERGDVSIVGDAELREAVQKLRKRHAAFLAALVRAQEANSQRPHSGLRYALAAMLSVIEKESNIE